MIVKAAPIVPVDNDGGGRPERARADGVDDARDPVGTAGRHGIGMIRVCEISLVIVSSPQHFPLV